MDLFKWTAVACVSASLLACQLPSAVVQADVPALLVTPTADSREELRSAVSSLLGVPTVMLADDARTTTSVLLIERSLRVTGRETERPRQLRLFKRGAACWLEEARDKQRIELLKSRCKDAPAS